MMTSRMYKVVNALQKLTRDRLSGINTRQMIFPNESNHIYKDVFIGL